MSRFNEQYLTFEVLISAKGTLDMKSMLIDFEELIKKHQMNKHNEVVFIYHQCTVKSERMT